MDTVVWLLIGLGLVIFGGDLFVKAATALAEALRLPRVVIGGTLMSICTTSPEIVVSIMSGLRGEPGLAVGNALGSAMCNIGLIGGTLALIHPVLINPREVRLPWSVMFVLSLALIVLSLDAAVTPIDCLLVLGAGVVYFVFDIVRNMRARAHARTHPTPGDPDEQEMAEPGEPPASKAKIVGMFVGGAALVVFGSRLLVDNAIELATAAGVSATVIGLTVVAVGTSLPEYVTAITAARKKVGDLSVGNIIGANIANLTLVVGSAGLLTPIAVGSQDTYVNFPAVLGLVSLFGVMLLLFQKISRTSGAVLLVAYIGYIAVVVLTAQPGESPAALPV